MKVVIGYPPFDSPKGRAFLAQNRQFQWGHTPWTAYPMVPAYAATLLKEAGYEVYWLDGIWGGQNYAQWEEELFEINPDILMIETKTPVVKAHWKIIDRLKRFCPAEDESPKGKSRPIPQSPTLKKSQESDSFPRPTLGGSDSGELRKNLKIVLVGDHVTALPEESMENCPVDYILTGGDYDFLLLNLCNHLTKGEKLEPGV
ncbi:hypothetical protein L6258_02220, partial [Candidatus Parcubacteria bacterium]|nr:hypothetical protein [Candidatus Parcubacteria bacterium]